ncbi:MULTISPECIES: HEAT repeat domain-containing protein [Streptomyces]|uniref:HEAT repeat domain-containing protein n=1 Tax=Streptomyces TaxID=1883 RepID=UPI0029AFC107|nr:HEAT repeat domain-containing protein [Streptomyces sp. ME02-6979.5a]MDX3340228.1 HEAT repeat domain-containing protein [Streptomyces sp. ME02-6979.5a]
MTVTGHDTGAGRGTSAGTGADAGAVRALHGLEDGRPAVRLRAALAVGTTPDPRFVDKLVERCAVEPDFFVRDMLTWALTRHPVSVTLPRLLGEVRSERASARSQALHTLSKIGDRRAWPAITRALLTDADDEVARSAWRAAVVLVPEEEEVALGALLATQLGRGGPETRLSLSRALIALGDAMASALAAAAKDPDPRVRAHALATDRLLRDPDAGFTFALEEAKRVVALGAGSGEGGGSCAGSDKAGSSGGSSGETGESSGSGEAGGSEGAPAVRRSGGEGP